MSINSVKINEISDDENSVLIIQVPRETRMLSDIYLSSLRQELKRAFSNKRIVIIGSDINIRELEIEDLTMMKLRNSG